MNIIGFKLLLIILTVILAYFLFFKIRSRFLIRVLALIMSLSMVILIIFPEYSTQLAHIFGIGRGTDFLLYLSNGLLFYLCLILYIKNQKLEDGLTKLTREMALKDTNDHRVD